MESVYFVSCCSRELFSPFWCLFGVTVSSLWQPALPACTILFGSIVPMMWLSHRRHQETIANTTHSRHLCLCGWITRQIFAQEVPNRLCLEMKSLSYHRRLRLRPRRRRAMMLRGHRRRRTGKRTLSLSDDHIQWAIRCKYQCLGTARFAKMIWDEGTRATTAPAWRKAMSVALSQ